MTLVFMQAVLCGVVIGWTAFEMANHAHPATVVFWVVASLWSSWLLASAIRRALGRLR